MLLPIKRCITTLYRHRVSIVGRVSHNCPQELVYIIYLIRTKSSLAVSPLARYCRIQLSLALAAQQKVAPLGTTPRQRRHAKGRTESSNRGGPPLLRIQPVLRLVARAQLAESNAGFRGDGVVVLLRCQHLIQLPAIRRLASVDVATCRLRQPEILLHRTGR